MVTPLVATVIAIACFVVGVSMSPLILGPSAPPRRTPVHVFPELVAKSDNSSQQQIQDLKAECSEKKQELNEKILKLSTASERFASDATTCHKQLASDLKFRQARFVVDAEEIASCKQKQATFHTNHRDEFFSEAGHEALRKLLIGLNTWPSDARAIDVGANIGQNIAFFESLSPKVEMLLLEPMPYNLGVLRQKIANNPRAHLIAEACADSPGQATFYLNNAQANQVDEHGALNPYGDPNNMPKVTVNITTLDAAVERVPELRDASVISFLKIDTEGWDLAVLRGGPKTLKKLRMVLFECSDTWFRPGGPPDNTFYNASETLRAGGLATFRIGPNQFVRIDGPFYTDEYQKDTYWSNCFAARPDDPVMPYIVSRFSSKIPECSHVFQMPIPNKP